MAANTLIPLNVFKSSATKLFSNTQNAYVTPQGVSTIILSAIAANYTANDVNITIKLNKGGAEYYLANNVAIFPYDSLSAISGRVILKANDVLIVSTTANNSVDFVLSYNEAADE